ncbi:MAG: ABC transporter permease [Chloroflexi bacterium]|nr:ABC transporter permease [Chloroflexota bacterium]MCH8910373.1 ABC transporter permease [Chloroflexota bacterium]
MISQSESTDSTTVPARFTLTRIPRASWRFIRRWPVIPVVILSVLLTFAVFAPLIATNDPNHQNLRRSLARPFWYTEYYETDPLGQKLEKRHILGADKFGRDVFSRVVFGTRVSLAVAIVSMASGTILGAWAGITTGFYGGLFDELMTRFVDVWNALPFLLIALVVSITVGQGVMIMMVLLIMLTWVGLVRNVRAEVLSLKTRDYVLAARVAGASDIRLMYKHILPGVSNLLLVLASLRVGGLILTEAALSFLGVGIPSRIPSWGQMISDGRDTLDEAWWISFFPGLGIFLTVMSMNFLGDWIRDRTDPRLRQLAD